MDIVEPANPLDNLSSQHPSTPFPPAGCLLIGEHKRALPGPLRRQHARIAVRGIDSRQVDHALARPPGMQAAFDDRHHQAIRARRQAIPLTARFDGKPQRAQLLHLFPNCRARDTQFAAERLPRYRVARHQPFQNAFHSRFTPLWQPCPVVLFILAKKHARFKACAPGLPNSSKSYIIMRVLPRMGCGIFRHNSQ